MGIPGCIREIGNISTEEYYASIDQMADAALADATLKTNPRVPTKAEVIELYKEIWDYDK